MSRLALILLAMFVTLGLSRMSAPKATRVALVLTLLVVSISVVKTG